jgi:hypothetical protein
MQVPTQIPAQLLVVVNQLFDLEKKIGRLTEAHSMARNLERIQNAFGEMGLELENPLGQPYNETRTDCEASIAGTGTDRLVVTDVIKPIVRMRQGGGSFIIQKGVVIVESRS